MFRSAVAAVSALLLTACGVTGSQRIDSRALDLAEVTAVETDIPCLLIIRKGPSNGAFWTGETNVLRHLSARRDGPALKISFTRADLSPTQPIRIELELTDLKAVRLGGAANAVLEPAHFSHLDVTLRDQADLTFTDAVLESLRIDVDHQAQVSGTAQIGRCTLVAKGASVLDLGQAEIQNLAIQAQGRASGQLNVFQSASGKVTKTTKFYWGQRRPQ